MIENTNKGDCLQRDSAEHKGHAITDVWCSSRKARCEWTLKTER